MLHRFARLLRHRWTSDTQHSVPPPVLARVAQKVARSESLHSGEIRICIEAGLPSGDLLSPLDMPALVRNRAVALFSELRVWDTAHNNGVLIYLLLADRAIELVADRGLSPHVTPQQWQALVLRLGDTLRQGDMEGGLTQAIEDVTTLLAKHFPLAHGAPNPNELPDTPAMV